MKISTLTQSIINCGVTPDLRIEEAQIVLHKADEPHLLGDLLDADVLAGEDGAEIDFATTDADAAAVADGDGSIVEGVFEV